MRRLLASDSVIRVATRSFIGDLDVGRAGQSDLATRRICGKFSTVLVIMQGI